VNPITQLPISSLFSNQTKQIQNRKQVSPKLTGAQSRKEKKKAGEVSDE
jgi:hypothetical protein